MIQIIGAGAIGCLWLGKLLQAGYPCHIVSRSVLSTNTLTLTDLIGKCHSFNVSHGMQLLHKTEQAQQSSLLVCVKAHQVLAALLQQQAYIKPQQAIILMHNGYGCAEQVAKHFPNNPIICATTANASLLTDALTITHTGAGPSYFGFYPGYESNNNHQPMEDRLNTYLHPLLEIMPDTHISNEIIEKCWLKLIINAVINPLTAIHQIKNGQLRCTEYAPLIQPLVLEVFAIAEAEQLTFDLNELQETVANVIKATAENYSSMNRDIHFGRQTEIEFINGYLIKKALQHNIETPILNDLYAQVRAMESH
ncbi:2-dehydropantoate 2-reductase [Psychromonas sp. B3M02]|uniref:ketopantoate reductase family protein n=1 Tax=Psychromonas sp. B3M02 TaxID=2267226 RepID=UPI000DEBC9FF|nr:ketopantoate reductase family protein [Psychromonas sp. B3M02]RBW46586.1 2-dehydropantoate 2-reductase [Psychromonas sp. B3M02]